MKKIRKTVLIEKLQQTRKCFISIKKNKGYQRMTPDVAQG